MGDYGRPMAITSSLASSFLYPVLDFWWKEHCSLYNIWLVMWSSGLCHSSHELSYPAVGPVSTGMGDRLWAGILSQYITSQLGQLSLESLRGH